MARRWSSRGPDVTAWIEANRVLPSHTDRINKLYSCDGNGHLGHPWSLLGIVPRFAQSPNRLPPTL